MILHKIYVKGELSDKYIFLDSLVQDGDLEKIYSFYKDMISNSNEYSSVKVVYKPEFDILQVFLKDYDNSKWKHTYQLISDKRTTH